MDENPLKLIGLTSFKIYSISSHVAVLYRHIDVLYWSFWRDVFRRVSIRDPNGSPFGTHFGEYERERPRYSSTSQIDYDLYMGEYQARCHSGALVCNSRRPQRWIRFATSSACWKFGSLRKAWRAPAHVSAALQLQAFPSSRIKIYIGERISLQVIDFRSTVMEARHMKDRK